MTYTGEVVRYEYTGPTHIIKVRPKVRSLTTGRSHSVRPW